MLKKITVIIFIILGLSIFLLSENEVMAIKYYYSKYTVKQTGQYYLESTPVSNNGDYLNYSSGSTFWTSYTVNQSTGDITVGGMQVTANSVNIGFTGYNQLSNKAIQSFTYVGNDYWYYQFTSNRLDSKYTLSSSQGTLVQSNIIAENGTYPSNGVHSDGYWYVRGSVANNAPTTPGAFIQPTGNLKHGESVTLSWGASSDPEGDAVYYDVDVSFNGGAWSSSVVARASSTSWTYVIPPGVAGVGTITSIKFRVSAEDASGLTSAYRESSTFTVVKPNTAPTTPTLTVPSVQFEHGDQHIINWNSTDAEGDALTYTLEASYNNGSTWTSLYSGANKNFTYTVPTNQTQVNFRVRAFDGTVYSAYTVGTNKTIREVMYYWSKYNNTVSTTSPTVTWYSTTEKGLTGSSNGSFEPLYTSYSVTNNQVVGSGTIVNSPNGIVPYLGTFYNSRGVKFIFVRLDSMAEWYYLEVKSITPGTSSNVRGSLISNNTQAGYNAYVNNALNSDGYWWVRGQRVLSGDTTPPIIELTEQASYASTSVVTVKTYDLSAVSVTKWAVGDQPSSYFTTGGTNVSGGQFIVTQNGTYTVYARDANGNATVQTIQVSKVDTVKPTGVVTQNPTDFTNGTVNLTAIGSDMESGLQRIKLPNGSYTVDAVTTYTVSANGTYTFEFEDVAGNLTVQSITVSNIDKVKPAISFTPESAEASFKDIEVKTTITDSGGSGYKQFRFAWTKDELRPTEGWSEWSATPNPLITQDKGGKWYLHMEAEDHAGNITYANSGIYEKIVVSGGPSVHINVFPVPTGQWVNHPIDVYVMDSGDSELLSKAKKHYEVTNSPLYPSTFTKTLPADKKVQLNLQGENFIHIQYVLDDGTKISSTSGPYLIDTGTVGDFEMKLTNASGGTVTTWTNQPVKLVITDPTSSSISGTKKQYRVEGVHTDWQNYTEGATINIEGESRIFGQIVSGNGSTSQQKVVTAKIDQTKPTVSSLRLVKNTDNTYDVRLTAADNLSGVKEVSINNGTKLTTSNNQFELIGLTAKPTHLVITDASGNVASPVPFASEPVITFDAPYKLDTPLYREDVVAKLTGATGYLIGNRGYACTTDPCSVTLSHNTTLSAVRTEGAKETRVSVKVNNVDQSTLQLTLLGKRSTTNAKDIAFTWNYELSNGTLTCKEDGQTNTYTVSGKTLSLNGRNYLYECSLTGDYKGVALASNLVTLYPDNTAPMDGSGDLSGRSKTTNVQLVETRLGTGYMINGRTDNYKYNTLPIPSNDVTAN